MPFKSKAQMRWMYANDPEMAEKWSEHTTDSKDLPERVEESKIWNDILQLFEGSPLMVDPIDQRWKQYSGEIVSLPGIGPVNAENLEQKFRVEADTTGNRTFEDPKLEKLYIDVINRRDELEKELQTGKIDQEAHDQIKKRLDKRFQEIDGMLGSEIDGWSYVSFISGLSLPELQKRVEIAKKDQKEKEVERGEMITRRDTRREKYFGRTPPSGVDPDTRDWFPRNLLKTLQAMGEFTFADAVKAARRSVDLTIDAKNLPFSRGMTPGKREKTYDPTDDKLKCIRCGHEKGKHGLIGTEKIGKCKEPGCDCFYFKGETSIIRKREREMGEPGQSRRVYSDTKLPGKFPNLREALKWLLYNYAQPLKHTSSVDDEVFTIDEIRPPEEPERAEVEKPAKRAYVKKNDKEEQEMDTEEAWKLFEETIIKETAPRPPGSKPFQGWGNMGSVGNKLRAQAEQMKGNVYEINGELLFYKDQMQPGEQPMRANTVDASWQEQTPQQAQQRIKTATLKNTQQQGQQGSSPFSTMSEVFVTKKHED